MNNNINTLNGVIQHQPGLHYVLRASILMFAAATASLIGENAKAATIPEPDAILFGHICLPTGPAEDSEDVSITARTDIDGETKVIGQYTLGDEESAANCDGSLDCYVLRIRVETVPDGHSPSGSAAVLNGESPAVVDIFVKHGTEEEVHAASITVDARAKILRRNLAGAPLSADLNGDTNVSLSDYALLSSAITGPSTSTSAACDPSDINRDGHIDLRDFSYLQNDFTGD